MANVEETTLVFVSANNNNNKFYRVELNGDTVTKTWGRVGATGTSSSEASGRVGYDRIIREKTRKGYKATETVASTTSQGSNNRGGDKNSAELKSIAIKTLLADASNNVLVQLIDTLVAKNNHAILEASGGQMKVNEDGLITTALGLVSRANIARARVLLADLQATTNELTRMTILEEYLTLVPQKVGSRRGWHKEFISTPEEFSKQTDFLKQLDESLGLHEDRKKAALAAANGTNATADDLVDKYADLFKFKISLLEDTKEFKRVQRFFEKNKKSMHTSSRMSLKRIYIIEDVKGRVAFDKKAAEIGNVQELWHGTRVWNILSILRRGLMIAAENLGTVQINGKMFGAGGYFSDESTKSLNYSEGYWDGGRRDNNCFMFLADVAMGNTHMAQRHVTYSNNHVQRSGKFDSIFAQGGASSVRNNEMIVWDADQINLKYICEFSA